ncbi:MAG: NAD-dependent epimerase/dehydratase family protein, partial [Paracoccaceae bacterium]
LGATGRLGRLVADALSRNCPQDFRVWFQHRVAGEAFGAQWFYWDFAQNGAGLTDLCGVVGDIGMLINFAGVTDSGNSQDLDRNASLAAASCDHARAFGIPRVLVASSVAVYGRPGPNERLSEGASLAPISGYGRAKCDMERRLLARPGRVQVTCLRIGNAAGADALLLNATGACSERPLNLDQFADGRTPRRSYIGPETLARVLISLARAEVSGRALPRVMNVASPVPVFMGDLVQALKAQAGDLAVRMVPARKGSIASVDLDVSLLEKFHEFAELDSDANEMIRQVLACRGLA